MKDDPFELRFRHYDGTVTPVFTKEIYESWRDQFADYFNPVFTESVIAEIKLGDLLGVDNGYAPEVATVVSVDAMDVAITSASYISGSLHIGVIEVSKSYRRKGIGSILIDYYKKLSKTGLVDASISIHKPEIREFYIRNGFIEDGLTVDNLFGKDMTFIKMSYRK